MLKVTEAAANQIRIAATQGGTEGMALRLAAMSKDDGSFDYRMGFDDVTEDDIAFKSEGVEIVMTPEDVPMLDEAVLDFVEIEEGQSEFIFLNPKDPTYVPPQDA